MSLHNWFDSKNNSYYGLEFVYETIPNELLPFDYETFQAYKGEFYVVTTNVFTGKAEYFPYTGQDKEKYSSSSHLRPSYVVSIYLY